MSFHGRWDVVRSFFWLWWVKYEKKTQKHKAIVTIKVPHQEPIFNPKN